VGHEVLASQVLVDTEARTRILVNAADVSPLSGEEKAKSQPNSENTQVS
jgi:hypothetical protein